MFEFKLNLIAESIFRVHIQMFRIWYFTSGAFLLVSNDSNDTRTLPDRVQFSIIENVAHMQYYSWTHNINVSKS